MSSVQSSSAETTSREPDMQPFSHSEEMPKPPSHFPSANSAMYDAYHAAFLERKRNFNSLASGHGFYYRLALSQNQDGRHDELIEYMVATVSGAREALIVDLEKIEEYFKPQCNGLGDGDGGQLRN